MLDIRLYGRNITSAVDNMIESIIKKESVNRCVSATGAHGMVYARQHPPFREVLDSFYLNLPDGMPGVWIGRLKGMKGMKRCYGPDFFKEFMEASKALPITHFFCGGNPGVADKLKMEVRRKFKNDAVVGTYSPAFLPIDQYPFKEIGDQINKSSPNVVWIGLSTPKQELFAARLKPFLKVNYIITVGAAFDFHVDKVVQAPRFISRMGLEWLFRLIMEPRRLFKRYAEVVPLFLYYNIQELLRFATKSK